MSRCFSRLSSRSRNARVTLKLGAALDFSVEMGSLTSERQLRTWKTMSRRRRQGRAVVAGGRARPGSGPAIL